ncbi:MAG: DUF1735 domain-containing protein [Alistipes sp.]|nr:DUF1735 domain-containing protein [Alistipes sp.]
MKTIIKLLLVAVVPVLFNACYDDYIGDYDDPSVCFAVAQPLRTVIASRDMTISVGVSIGGKREVDMNDWATFVIDPSIMSDPSRLMPESHYVLASPDTFTVKRSNMPVADVEISFTDAFYADPLCVENYYILPFTIVDNSVGDVTEGMESTQVMIKYVSTYSGTYYYRGTSTKLDAAGNLTDDVEAYGSSILINCPTRIFETISPDVVVRRGIANKGNDAQNRVQLTVVEDNDSPTGYSVVTDTAPGSTLVISGGGTWDPDGEYAKFELEYTYNDGADSYYVVEELIRRQDPLEDLRVETW